MQKPPHPKNKFGIKTTEVYYKEIRNESDDFVLRNVDVATVNKILKNLDVTKCSGIDQISAKFLKDRDPVIALHFSNINLSIKLETFPSKCKIAEIKPSFIKGN